MLDRPTFRQVRKTARNMRDLDRREATALISDDPDQVAYEVCNYGTPIFAVMRNRIPAYVFGTYIQPHNDVWAAWGFGTDRFPEVAFEVSYWIKRIVMPSMREAGIDRCECLSLAEKIDAHRWLKWLGAVEERDITDYRHTGENFKLFAWR